MMAIMAARQPLILAVAQFCCAIGKVQENLGAVARLVAQAADQHARFILFPEDALTGYPAERGSATRVALAGDGPEIAQLAGLSRKHNLTIAAGFIERHGDLFHSSTAIIQPDGQRSIIRKRSVDARDQAIGLVASHPDNPDFVIANRPAAMCICMDGTDNFFTAAQSRGIQIILHPSGGACTTAVHASDAQANDVDARERANCRQCVQAAQQRAQSLNVTYCVANPVGFDGDRGYPGNSFIIRSTGEVAIVAEGTAIIESMHEAVIVAAV